MFQYCSSLTSIDLSNFNTQSLKNFANMFYNCKSLKYADISSFISENSIDIFSELPSGCQIIMNQRSENKIKTIPTSCTINYKN